MLSVRPQSPAGQNSNRFATTLVSLLTLYRIRFGTAL
jgi:hypothetical protein